MRGIWALPLVVLGAALVLVPLSAVVEIPGERGVKELFGVEYAPACTPTARRVLGPWRAEAPLPTLRDEPRGARVGDGAYLVGGIGFYDPPTTRSVDTVARYALPRQRYRALPPLPARLNHVGVVPYADDVYVVGGFGERDGRAVATNRAWRYRVAERRWESLAPMPTPRGAHGVAVVGRTLYAIGGQDPDRPDRHLDNVEAYDLGTGRWSTRAPMPTPRDHLGVAAAGGQIHAVGGRLPGGVALDVFERYDPATDRWTRGPDYPLATSGIALASVASRLVAAGGEGPSEGRVFAETWSYRPQARSWSREPNMPVAKHGYAMVTRGDRLYVFGGSVCTGFRPTRTAESLRLTP